MKKSIALILLVVSLPLLIMGCNETNYNVAPDFTFDENDEYIGFKALPTGYTIEDATKDGYLVTEDLKIFANEKLWTNFIESSAKDKNVSLRLVKFYTTESSKGPFYTDIFYEDGSYYSFDSSAPSPEKEPYKYLLDLRGKHGNPIRDAGFIVLTNDKTLTFDQVIARMISSSMNFINSIPKHEIIMFK